MDQVSTPALVSLQSEEGDRILNPSIQILDKHKQERELLDFCRIVCLSIHQKPRKMYEHDPKVDFYMTQEELWVVLFMEDCTVFYQPLLSLNPRTLNNHQSF